MTHLTPDEVIERLRAEFPNEYLWNRGVSNKLAKAGLAVVDATDTLNEPTATGIYNAVKARRAKWGHEPLTIPEIGAVLHARANFLRTSADVTTATGGSPGGSGTDDDGTRHAATPECVWSDVDPAWCNTHARYYRCPASTSGMCLELVESSKPCPAGECDRTPEGSGTVTQETSADDIVAWLDQRAHYHQWHGNEDIAERYVVAADLIRVHSQAAPPPFPGAHPGPVVDGQPTWGASYHAIPNGWGWEWSINGESWYPATAMPPAGRAQWVQVREALQAPRWEVDEDGWLTFDRCIAMILTHPHTLFDGVEMDRSARDKARDALVADVRAARDHDHCPRDTDTLRQARFLADLAVEDPGEISAATADLLSLLTGNPVEPYEPDAGETD